MGIRSHQRETQPDQRKQGQHHCGYEHAAAYAPPEQADTEPHPMGCQAGRHQQDDDLNA